FGMPQWIFGRSAYAFLSPTRIVCAYISNGIGYLAEMNVTTGELRGVATEFNYFESVHVGQGGIYLLAGQPTAPLSLVRLDQASGAATVLRSSCRVPAGADYLSLPELISFPTAGGEYAQGFFSRPLTAHHTAPPGEPPPLMVISHGGPTAAAAPIYQARIQYWTSRGIAVLDVNYRGSTGYGREYRERLRG